MIPLTDYRLDPSLRDKAKFLQNESRFADVKFVRMRSIADAQQNGMLAFKLPMKENIAWAKSTDIRAESIMDYEWAGRFEDYLGEMTVVSHKGMVRAHISYDGKEYGIYPIENDIHAVARLVPPDSTFQGGCALDAVQASLKEIDENQLQPEKEGYGLIEGESSREVACAQNNVRVLVLHTPNARAAVPNFLAEAQLGISRFNQAETNSQVAGTLGRLELAGVSAYTLPGGNERQFDIEQDINDLIDDDVAQNLREQFNADLVVLFTDGNYSDPSVFGSRFYGLAGNFDQNFDIQLIDNRSFAIVEVEESDYEDTFAHEVGHLFAMSHQTCAEWPNPGCDNGGTFDHGYNFRRRRWPRADLLYHTLMHQIRAGSTQILHFSNPGVNYDGQATGQAGLADNARQLEVADFTVSRYELGDDLNASIDGPTSVNLYVGNTWESVHSCGSGYTFLWETSDDGFNYYWAGNGETMSRSVYNSSQDRFYIRLTVTANTQTVTSFRTVYVNNARFANTSAKSSNTWQEEVGFAEPELGESVLLEEAYPNPWTDQTQVSFYLPKSDLVSLDILTLEGKHIKNVMGGAIEAGDYEFTLSRDGLPAGIYLYQLTVGEKQYSRRLIIQE